MMFDEDRGVEILIYQTPVQLYRGSTLCTIQGGGIALFPPRLDVADRPKGAPTYGKAFFPDGSSDTFALPRPTYH